MDLVLIAVIGLILLLGLVAIGVGNKGWSWGTVAAAVLLLLAASGYLYLAARLAERERSWRTVVAKNQAEIDRITGGANANASPQSLAALRTKRDRWMRALAFVDTWHGRSWTKASLAPPRDGKPGTLSIEMASATSEVAPLAAGAEVAVFDNATVANEGEFLGLFRVDAVKANKGDERCQLTIMPAATPAPPSESDTRLWTRNYDEVTVYESLPADRWLAFHTTTDEAGENAAGGDGTSTGRWRPEPKKTAAEDPLKNLEAQMEALRQHGSEVPQDQWPELAEKPGPDGTLRRYLKSPNGPDEILAGRYWAFVEFTKNVRFTKRDAFTLDDPASATPVDGDAEAGGDLADGGAAAAGDGDLATGPSDADPTAAAISRQFTEKKFATGEKAEFDLQTALELQNDKQFVRITSVVERRPLVDPFAAIRGTEFWQQDAGGKPLRSEGIDAIRQGLLVEMASIEESIARITRSRTNVEAQAKAVADEQKQLDDDLIKWGKDVAAATATATAFDDRFRAATIELAALETSIVRLGEELSDSWGVLTETIDAAAR